MPNPTRAAEAKRLRDQGLSYAKIGARLGVSAPTAERAVKAPLPSPKTCAGRDCDVDLTGTHKKTKWCSERCRRRTKYTNICKCGAEIYDGSAEPDTVCGECKHEARYGERNERLVEMWEAGEPTWYIAEQLGMEPNTVRGWVTSRRRFQGESHTQRRKPNRDCWPEIEKLWAKGLTGREIGERLGLSGPDVSARAQNMRAAGIDLPRRQRA